MSSMKWKEISTIVWVFQKIFTAIQDLCQVEEPLKCRFQPESTKKEASIQALNNCHSKQSVTLYKSFQRLWPQTAVWTLSESLLNLEPSMLKEEIQQLVLMETQEK